MYYILVVLKRSIIGSHERLRRQKNGLQKGAVKGNNICRQNRQIIILKDFIKWAIHFVGQLTMFKIMN